MYILVGISSQSATTVLLHRGPPYYKDVLTWPEGYTHGPLFTCPYLCINLFCSIILNLRGGIPRPKGNFTESMIQAMLGGRLCK